MIRRYVRQAVADDDWREGCDDDQALRDENGVTADGVLVSGEDGNDVTRDRLRSGMGSP